jgi:uncharacterized protein YdaT
MENGEVFEVTEYEGDGIYLTKKFIKVTDGSYAEVPSQYYPTEEELKEQHRIEREDSNRDDNIRGWNQEDSEGDCYSLDEAGAVY